MLISPFFGRCKKLCRLFAFLARFLWYIVVAVGLWKKKFIHKAEMARYLYYK